MRISVRKIMANDLEEPSAPAEAAVAPEAAVATEGEAMARKGELVPTLDELVPTEGELVPTKGEIVPAEGAPIEAVLVQADALPSEKVDVPWAELAAGLPTGLATEETAQRDELWRQRRFRRRS